MTRKPSLFAVLFFLPIMLIWAVPLQAQSSFAGGELTVHGAIIMDFFQNHNADDIFPHYATETGGKFLSTVNESRFSISGNFGEINGLETTSEVSFDFMGDNGFEIVSAWIRLERGDWYFLAGKTENLVATGETSLNYDGFYSAGGIQTGAHANQNQIQIGYKPNNRFILALSATDEPAQTGNMTPQMFSSSRPATEAALIFDFPRVAGKIAAHRGDMRFSAGEHFHPSLIMGELNIPVGESLSVISSAFRASAGSQFFTTDILFDCLTLPDGHIRELSATGGFTELLFRRGEWEMWAGAGVFSLTEYSRRQLRHHHPEDALVSNHRLSLGTRHSFSPHLRVGCELTRYRTSHFKGTKEISVSAISVQLQVSLDF